MKKKKKIIAIIAGVIVLCGVAGSGMYVYNTANRREIKQTLCDENPKLCPCYTNIVDYRFTDEDVKVLKLFQAEIKKRDNVSALEFASIEEFQRLNGLVSICQLEQMPRQVRQPVQAQVVQPVQKQLVQPQVEEKPVKKTTKKK